MGKHSFKNSSSIVRNTTVIATIGMGAAILSPGVASAAPVTLPNSNITVDVPQEFKPFADQALAAYNQQAAALGSSSVPAVGGAAPMSAPVSSVGQRIADAALSKQGAPYAWGAAGPNAFDCSGLTSWAHAQVGKSIPRTSSAQAAAGQPVSLDALQPGDVISYYSGASHVAIYIGNGKIVHALQSGSPVQVNDLHYMPINNAVRF